MNLLYQGEVWQPQGGPVVRLAEMTGRHRRNLLHWLDEHAEALKEQAELEAVLQSETPCPCDVCSSGADCGGGAILDEDLEGRLTAREWLATLPLVRRLRELEGIPA